MPTDAYDVNKARSMSFDKVAEAYDLYRPHYPEAMVDFIVQAAGLRPESRILEIGSGTGKATLPFARRGFSILCIEPGRNMATVAARKLQDHANVRFELNTFEECSARHEEFDLVIAGQAFHWVAKDTAYIKAAWVLRPGGHLALFWNRPHLADAALREGLDRIYAEHAPELSRRPAASEHRPGTEEVDAAAEMERDGLFRLTATRQFPWQVRYTTAQYLGLLATHSNHLLLPTSRRERVEDAVAALIDHHGGYLDHQYVTMLYLAQVVK